MVFALPYRLLKNIWRTGILYLEATYEPVYFRVHRSLLVISVELIPRYICNGFALEFKLKKKLK